MLGDPLAPQSLQPDRDRQIRHPLRTSPTRCSKRRSSPRSCRCQRRQARGSAPPVPIVAIDPADARDHDDAIWAEPDGKGGFNAIVAIADVSFYVRPGGALDREARKRGNSVYFPDRVVPMLPEVLSADVCSLKQGEDRAAMACHLAIDAERQGHQLALHPRDRADCRQHRL